MAKLTRWNALRIVRDWKTRLLAGVFFVFLASFSLLYRQQNLVFPSLELESEYAQTQQVFGLIPDSHFEGKTGQEVQRRLGEIQTLTGVNRYLIGYEEEEAPEFILGITGDYVENGQQIAENIVYLHDETDFQSNETLIENYLPSRNEAVNQMRFFHALRERELDIEWNPYSSSQVLRQQMELVSGVFIFLFVALLASDHFTKDQTNYWSVTQGLPVKWKGQWRIRSLLLWLVMWSSILFGVVISYGVSLLFETTGSLNYPVAYYINGTVSYLSLWQYVLLLLASNMLTSYVLLLLTTGLSWMFRNMYLVLLLTVSAFFLPMIWQSVSAFTSWQPSLYMSVLNVVTGETARFVGETGVEFWKIPFAFLVIWLILEVLFSKVFSLIPTETLGLKRREHP